MEIIKPEGMKQITAGELVTGCVCSLNRDSAKTQGNAIGMCAGGCAYGPENMDANATLASQHSYNK